MRGKRTQQLLQKRRVSPTVELALEVLKSISGAGAPPTSSAPSSLGVEISVGFVALYTSSLIPANAPGGWRWHIELDESALCRAAGAIDVAAVEVAIVVRREHDDGGHVGTHRARVGDLFGEKRRRLALRAKEAEAQVEAAESSELEHATARRATGPSGRSARRSPPKTSRFLEVVREKERETERGTSWEEAAGLTAKKKKTSPTPPRTQEPPPPSNAGGGPALFAKHGEDKPRAPPPPGATTKPQTEAAPAANSATTTIHSDAARSSPPSRRKTDASAEGSAAAPPPSREKSRASRPPGNLTTTKKTTPASARKPPPLSSAGRPQRVAKHDEDKPQAPPPPGAMTNGTGAAASSNTARKPPPPSAPPPAEATKPGELTRPAPKRSPPPRQPHPSTRRAPPPRRPPPSNAERAPPPPPTGPSEASGDSGDEYDDDLPPGLVDGLRGGVAVCGACGVEVPSTVASMTIGTQSFHATCCVCVDCNVDLATGAVGITVGEDGALLCAPCETTRRAEICSVCDKPIAGEFVRAVGQCFHTECFACVHCGQKFSESEPCVKGVDGKPSCTSCERRQRGEVCSACDEVLSGQFVAALGLKFHQECFRCSVCDAMLGDGKCLQGQKDKKLYCEPCHSKKRKLSGARTEELRVPPNVELFLLHCRRVDTSIEPTPSVSAHPLIEPTRRAPPPSVAEAERAPPPSEPAKQRSSTATSPTLRPSASPPALANGNARAPPGRIQRRPTQRSITGNEAGIALLRQQSSANVLVGNEKASTNEPLHREEDDKRDTPPPSGLSSARSSLSDADERNREMMAELERMKGELVAEKAAKEAVEGKLIDMLYREASAKESVSRAAAARAEDQTSLRPLPPPPLSPGSGAERTTPPIIAEQHPQQPQQQRRTVRRGGDRKQQTQKQRRRSSVSSGMRVTVMTPEVRKRLKGRRTSIAHADADFSMLLAERAAFDSPPPVNAPPEPDVKYLEAMSEMARQRNAERREKALAAAAVEQTLLSRIVEGKDVAPPTRDVAHDKAARLVAKGRSHLHRLRSEKIAAQRRRGGASTSPPHAASARALVPPSSSPPPSASLQIGRAAAQLARHDARRQRVDEAEERALRNEVAALQLSIDALRQTYAMAHVATRETPRVLVAAEGNLDLVARQNAQTSGRIARRAKQAESRELARTEEHTRLAAELDRLHVAREVIERGHWTEWPLEPSAALKGPTTYWHNAVTNESAWLPPAFSRDAAAAHNSERRCEEIYSEVQRGWNSIDALHRRRDAVAGELQASQRGEIEQGEMLATLRSELHKLRRYHSHASLGHSASPPVTTLVVRVLELEATVLRNQQLAAKCIVASITRTVAHRSTTSLRAAFDHLAHCSINVRAASASSATCVWCRQIYREREITNAEARVRSTRAIAYSVTRQSKFALTEATDAALLDASRRRIKVNHEWQARSHRPNNSAVFDAFLYFTDIIE